MAKQPNVKVSGTATNVRISDLSVPPVTVETVEEHPLETIETVQIVPADESPIALPVDVPPVDDSADCWLYNEDTGELRLTRARAGYAPAPMPFGFRVAKNDEIPGK